MKKPDIADAILQIEINKIFFGKRKLLVYQVMFFLCLGVYSVHLLSSSQNMLHGNITTAELRSP